ncbi:MAG: phosphohydrolase [Candidatus Krumholzibacteriia bacterium]
MRILAIADTTSEAVYADGFPQTLPPFDLVVSAGDVPGHVLEFIAARQDTPPVYVLGNHALGYLRDPRDGTLQPVGGCLNVHGHVVRHAGLLIAGIEGCLRYRPGPHQASPRQMELQALRLAPRLAWHRWRGRRLDILLTHAAPCGPHAAPDRPHHGVAAFNRLHRWWRPRVHIHGHVHLYHASPRREYTTPEGVRVINAYGMTLVDL